MSHDMTKYECSSCKFYDYEGKNEKGFCSYYRGYYYDDDSCGYWEESDEYSSGGCFLTTACCEYKGLADDCYELQIMRKFRDEFLLKNDVYGRNLVQLYYEEAPGIVERIMESDKKDEYLSEIYDTVLEIINDLEKGKNEEATIIYLMMVHKMSKT